MKRKFLAFLMTLSILSCSSQSMKYGLYRSKEGSFLKIKSDGTFDYSKEFHVLKLDNPVYKILERSKGKFHIKDNFLILNSNNKYLDSIIDKSIIVTQKESSKKSTDSINITIKKNNSFKVYICNTGIETRYNIEDISNAFLLANKENYVKKFYTSDFTIKVYPNIDNYEIRTGFSDLKSICFESKKMERKDPSQDIFIEIDFDILNFYFVELKDEIVLVNKNKLFFRGEEFRLENK